MKIHITPKQMINTLLVSNMFGLAGLEHAQTPKQEQPLWSNDGQFALSVSMQFEIGAVGFNAFLMHHSPNRLKVLQEPGFICHINARSHMEPSPASVNGKSFAVVPYIVHHNNVNLYTDSVAMAGVTYAQDLKDNFDVFYAEGKSRSQTVSISTHDHLPQSPLRVKALDRFITYAKQHLGVVFMRKEEIARWIKEPGDAPANPACVFSFQQAR